MPTRKAHARWEGSIKEGKGEVDFGSGAFIGAYSFVSRFEEGAGTNPEELLGAAHASCFAMALSNGLAKAGHTDITLDTRADVTFQPGQGITGIKLTVRGSVPGLTAEQFTEFAEAAKSGCPVSQALSGTTITLDAALG